MPAPNELVSSIILSILGAFVLLWVSIPLSFALLSWNVVKRTLGYAGTSLGLINESRLDYKLPNPKCVLITGSSRGIGAALAMEFADKQRTLILCARNADRLKEVQKACELRGCPKVITLSLDVSDRNHTIETLRKLDDEHHIDLVIANAGLTSTPDSFEKDGLDGMSSSIVGTNVLGVIYTMTPILDGMKRRGHGQVAIMGSVMGLFGTSAIPLYAASKAFLQSMARDMYFPIYNKYGVHLSLIAPGFVDSKLTRILKDDAKAWWPLWLFWNPQAAAKHIRQRIMDNHYYIPFPFYLEAMQYSAYILPPPLQPYFSHVIGLTGVAGNTPRDALCLS